MTLLLHEKDVGAVLLYPRYVPHAPLLFCSEIEVHLTFVGPGTALTDELFRAFLCDGYSSV